MIVSAAKSIGYSDVEARKLPEWYRRHLKELGYKTLRVDNANKVAQDIKLARVT